MRKDIALFCAFLAVVLLASFAFAGNGGLSTVTTNTTHLLGEANRKQSGCSAAAWVANTAYPAGSVACIRSVFHMAIVRGTSGATAPALTSTGDVADNTVTWRKMLPAVDGRKHLELTNLGATNIFFDFGPAARIDRGYILLPGQTIVWSGDGVPQNQVTAASASGSQGAYAAEY